jgi:phosphoglycerate dehydrogenase-like enzyme
MRIVFHGENAASFSHDFQRLVGEDAQISVLPDTLIDRAHSQTYVAADVIVGGSFSGNLPQPRQLQLFHVPGAGYDAVDLDAIPGTAVVCNCFGHEQAIAEYVMTALLERHVPLAAADRHLRQGQWTYAAGAPARVHGELAEKTIGLLGFGHIGKAIAARAKAFEMKVHVANRSPVPTSSLVDRSFALNRLGEFWSSADFFVVSVPSNADTVGIVNVESFAAMRASAVILNDGRGPTIDEQ